MEQKGKFDLKDIIKFLDNEDVDCQININKSESCTDEIDARLFLAYAKEDIKDDSDRGRINALSNAKRAVEARVDEILKLSCLSSFASRGRWGFPYKLLVLRNLGVSSPDILRDYVTSKRNLLEHEYIKPNKEEVKYLTDIVELFLSATEQHVEKGYIQGLRITFVKDKKEGRKEKITGNRGYINYEYGIWNEIKVDFDLRSEAISIRYRESPCEISHNSFTGEKKIKTPAINDEYNFYSVLISSCKEEDVRDLILAGWRRRNFDINQPI